jgi:hypothetical protein
MEDYSASQVSLGPRVKANLV